MQANTDGSDRFQSWQDELDVDDVCRQLDAQTEDSSVVRLLTRGDG